ncbi:MAG: hypothetical protein J1D77_06950 [Muribaculaceae bacterium]|nr:hypothetical protein [Muribaculaceae bacterium]
MRTEGLKNKLFPRLCALLIVGILIGESACGNKDKEEATIGGEEVPTFEEVEGANSLNSPVAGVRSIRVRNIGPLRQVFNDSNYLQLEAARRLGIEPISDLASAYNMRRPIVKVESNEFYQIDSLRHSVPYLVPEAAILLEDIGRNFIDSLSSRGGDSYRIKVTSLLRTPETVSRLRRVNVNATDSSTHQYATTFDISYTNFYCLDETRQINQGDLKNLLGEVLYDLRKNGRCLVKYEYKTGCFHVTAL